MSCDEVVKVVKRFPYVGVVIVDFPNLSCFLLLAFCGEGGGPMTFTTFTALT